MCLLLTAYCLLLTAYCLLLTAYCLLLTAYCLLLTAYCLLNTNSFIYTPSFRFIVKIAFGLLPSLFKKLRISIIF
ncbi:hypothetical protein BTO17_07400 [Polaribacter reichenbachii]|nr:hypothetical protein BTO17_07400 [Polaribacter reichenbachii]